MKNKRNPILILLALLGLIFLGYMGYKDGKAAKNKGQAESNTVTTTDNTTPGITTTTSEVVKEYTGLSEEEMNAIREEKAKEKAAEIEKNRPSQRAHAKELVKSRALKEEAASILTADHWAYEFIFDGYEMSKSGAYDGHWLKFEDDHTYEYGLYNEVQGKGQYHYSMTSGMMIMVDDKEDKMPEEWKVQSQDEVMILVGAGYFGNNPRQCKLLRWNGRPVNRG